MSELPLTPFQQKIAELILDTPAPGKHAARSAIAHIQKAWMIKDIDREMSAFRALTGEEESATAIFHALERRGYVGAEKLNRRNHSHKWSLTAFFAAMAEVFASSADLVKPAIEIQPFEGTERVRVRARILTPNGEQFAYPIPPLNFEAKCDGIAADYSVAFAAIAQERNFSSIKKFVQDLANRRNQILYSSQNGVPSVTNCMNTHLTERRGNIFRNLCIYLMIDPYPERQTFVQHCLDALLRMLDALPNDAP